MVKEKQVLAPPPLAAVPKCNLSLDRMIASRIRLLAKSLGLDAMRLYTSRFRVSVQEWQILAVLGVAQPLSASQITRRTPMDRPQVSRTVRRMIKAKLLVSRDDPNDGRRSLIWMTAKGAEIHDQIVPLALLRQQKLLEALAPDEQAAFERIIQKLNERIKLLDRTGI
jgi:DNA-binding MarR family transcriptional regulator